jgi:hypothetical protein
MEVKSAFSEHSAESATSGDSSKSYRIPLRVRQKFANPALLEPVCYGVIELFSDREIHFVDRTKSLDDSFQELFKKMEYKDLYNTVVDFLLWTRSLDKICRRKGIDKKEIIYTSK